MSPVDESDNSKHSEMRMKSNGGLGPKLKGFITSWLPSSFPKISRYPMIEDTDTQLDNEVRLAAELTKKNNAIRRWRCITGILTAVLAMSWVLLFPSNPLVRYPQPEDGTDNVLKWMKQAEVAPGHYWCGPTTVEAKSRGCTFNKLHNR